MGTATCVALGFWPGTQARKVGGGRGGRRRSSRGRNEGRGKFMEGIPYGIVKVTGMTCSRLLCSPSALSATASLKLPSFAGSRLDPRACSQGG